MSIRWVVSPGIRCNLIGYAARNLSGRRAVMQIFPTGSRKGSLDGEALSSLVIRAPTNTRVILAVSDEDDWQASTWRAIRVTEGDSLRSEQRNGLRGVRIPDLELMDRPGAKRSDPDFESSYPYVDALDEGTGWTFGSAGPLKNRIAMIRVEREEADGIVLTPAEAVLKQVLDALETSHPAAAERAREVGIRALTRHLEGMDADELAQRLG